MSSWTATERYGLGIAPGGLALVQDLLNTRPIGEEADMLSTGPRARRWAGHATAAWAAQHPVTVEPPTLTDRDVVKLRSLRTTLEDWLSGAPPPAATRLPGTSQFIIDGGGRVMWTPAGKGWQWMASALWGEMLSSQRAGTWPRLKLCRHPQCRSAFYDRSKNNSGVWHDVKVCGNAINLRASRARRRASNGRDTG